MSGCPTAAIVKTLEDHRRPPDQGEMDALFGDPRMPLSQQVDAYQHRNNWVNRLILGDSLVVMNSLLRFEGLGGQVQMIYIDPPYGVRFGSNFQPFVRDPEAPSGNNDKDMTREPEMVQAYRDTWQLGLHSYLTYLRDRLLAARDLLTATGSVFVQISDENLHHVRELMDEVFGSENFVSQISFQTTSGFDTKTIATLGDFLLWYARDKHRVYVSKLYLPQPPVIGEGNAKWLLLPDGSYRGVTASEKRREVPLPRDARLYFPDNLQSQGAAATPQPFEFAGRTWLPNPGSHWKANYPVGMQRLADEGRIHVAENSIRYRRFHTDFPFQEIGNIWTDTITGNFTDKKLYVVQTNRKVIERCILLTTQPGELVVDPTCGSGSTAYVAERWGRRWIAIDTSRVPLALARQLLLTATYSWFELMDPNFGPVGGFRYLYKENTRAEQTGGIAMQVRLETVANGEKPSQKVLVDRPEPDEKITRISGPFVVEATLPTPQQLTDEPTATTPQDEPSDHVARMIEVLRRSPTIALPGNRKVTLKSIRRPGRSLSLSAEAQVDLDASGTARGGDRCRTRKQHRRPAVLLACRRHPVRPGGRPGHRQGSARRRQGSQREGLPPPVCYRLRHHPRCARRHRRRRGRARPAGHLRRRDDGFADG
jgi:adenine-specific DNA-methyltransferase